MDNNINIYFHGEEPDGTAVEPSAPGSTPNPDMPEKQKEKKGKASSFETKAIALYVAKQGLNIATTRVGQYTRDNALQNKVNAGLQLTGYSLAILHNPVLGTLGVVANTVNSVLDYNFNGQQESSRLGIINQRAGNINRSR